MKYVESTVMLCGGIGIHVALFRLLSQLDMFKFKIISLHCKIASLHKKHTKLVISVNFGPSCGWVKKQQ